MAKKGVSISRDYYKSTCSWVLWSWRASCGLLIKSSVSFRFSKMRGGSAIRRVRPFVNISQDHSLPRVERWSQEAFFNVISFNWYIQFLRSIYSVSIPLCLSHFQLRYTPHMQFHRSYAQLSPTPLPINGILGSALRSASSDIPDG